MQRHGDHSVQFEPLQPISPDTLVASLCFSLQSNHFAFIWQNVCLLNHNTTVIYIYIYILPNPCQIVYIMVEFQRSLLPGDRSGVSVIQPGGVTSGWPVCWTWVPRSTHQTWDLWTNGRFTFPAPLHHSCEKWGFYIFTLRIRKWGSSPLLCRVPMETVNWTDISSLPSLFYGRRLADGETRAHLSLPLPTLAISLTYKISTDLFKNWSISQMFPEQRQHWLPLSASSLGGIIITWEHQIAL